METKNHKGKILVVEDEWVLFDELREILEGNGYEVSPFLDNYADAMVAAMEMQPDLALLDIMLNFDKCAEDGVMLAKALKAELGIPLLFLSTAHDTNTLKRIRAIQESHFLIRTKPFLDRVQLLTSVQLAIFPSSPREGKAKHQSPPPGKHPEAIHCHYKNKKIQIPIDEIVVAASSTEKRNKMEILTRSKMVEVMQHKGDPKSRPEIPTARMTIRELVTGCLPVPTFLQIHKSYIVRLSEITAYDAEQVYIGDYPIPRGKINDAELEAYLAEKFQ